MRRLGLLAAAAVAVSCAVIFSSAGGAREGTYREAAPPGQLARWERDYARKRLLVPPTPEPAESREEAVDFSGTYRFGPFDYSLTILQRGDQVTFRSGGVDRQDIGGAFETIGSGVVEKGRIFARWWCFDLSRNFANNGGAEFRFESRDRLKVRYYHDADERIEEGYGLKSGVNAEERLHYRIRIPHPVREFPKGLRLKGTVRGREGEAIEDAVVMLRHEEVSAVRTDREGRWSLEVKRLAAVQMLAAAAPGYRTQVLSLLLQEVRDLHFLLEPSPFGDDGQYRFVDPTPDKAERIWNCGNCHKGSFEEWEQSRHAVAATSAVTLAVYERDFLPALEAGKATGDAGLCACCHAPQAALDGRVARLDEVTGTARAGNHCDFCHKVHHTEDPLAPGVRGSLQLGRPSPGDESVPGPIKRVYGPLADSDYLFMGPVFSPFFTTSALCAGCHQYVSGNGLPALDTYAEWRAWAAGREEAESCQDCHMPTGTSMEGNKLARRICINALRRPQEQIHDHSFLGRELAPNAVTLLARAELKGDELVVESRVCSEGVGHKLPTGSADKHLVLVVRAKDAVLLEGPTVPGHAGALAGLPGREFAQVLADTEGRTHVPFWRASQLVRDSRLAPGEPQNVRHRFRAPAERPLAIRVELHHRLRFEDGDVARDVQGAGVRPLDMLIAEQRLEVR
ncbi:MAG: multiheme c-type cytochrome [Planctomycetota bacterium]|jgi:hypothetical protein